MATSLRDRPDLAAAWILDVVGFGASAERVDALAELGVEGMLDRLFDHGEEVAPPFADLDVGHGIETGDVATMVQTWLGRLLDSERPIDDWLAWFWHGHLVSSFRSVRSARLMANQIDRLHGLGGGDARTLLREITTDSAMLVYLDGRTSTRAAPNENYARELLELFALGLPHPDRPWTEGDVAAGAAALTGWVVTREGEAWFVEHRHDGTPRRFLGVDGVHDVDTVIDAVVAHPRCAPHLTSVLAAAVLGPGVDAAFVAEEAQRFAAEGLAIRPLLRRLLSAGIDGARTPIVQSPVGWLLHTVRALRPRRAEAVVRPVLEAAGQVPLVPPDVAGWPGGAAWLTTSATAARLQAAVTLAESASPTALAVLAAEVGDLAALARAFGRPGGFRPASVAALDASGARGSALLSLALSLPDLMVIADDADVPAGVSA